MGNMWIGPWAIFAQYVDGALIGECKIKSTLRTLSGSRNTTPHLSILLVVTNSPPILGTQTCNVAFHTD